MNLEFESRTQVAPLVHSIRTLNPMSENSSLADALNLKVYPRTQRLWCLLLKANSNVGETNVGESIGSRSEPRTQLPFSVPSNQSLNSMLEKLSSVEASALVADPATTRTLNPTSETIFDEVLSFFGLIFFFAFLASLVVMEPLVPNCFLGGKASLVDPSTTK